MTVDVDPRRVIPAETRLRLVDCDIHPMLRRPSDIRAYLDPAWHDYHDQFEFENPEVDFYAGDRQAYADRIEFTRVAEAGTRGTWRCSGCRAASSRSSTSVWATSS